MRVVLRRIDSYIRRFACLVWGHDVGMNCWHVIGLESKDWSVRQCTICRRVLSFEGKKIRTVPKKEFMKLLMEGRINIVEYKSADFKN